MVIILNCLSHAYVNRLYKPHGTRTHYENYRLHYNCYNCTILIYTHNSSLTQAIISIITYHENLDKKTKAISSFQSLAPSHQPMESSILQEQYQGLFRGEHVGTAFLQLRSRWNA